MKKPLLILLLSIAALAVKAQNMSFDETVKYINDKINPNKATLAIKKDGTVTRIEDNKTANLFDLAQNTFSDPQVIKQDRGIIFWRNTADNSIRLLLSSADIYKYLFIVASESEKDIDRLYNAMVYLRSLCTKGKDPFDN